MQRATPDFSGFGYPERMLASVFFLLSAAVANDHPPAAAPAAPSKTTTPKRSGHCEDMAQRNAADFWNLSQCYYQGGNFAKAVQILKSIYRENPKEVDAIFVASWLLWSDGHSVGGELEEIRTKEALEELTRLKEAQPKDWRVRVELGDYYFLRLNKAVEAYAEYNEARRIYDGDYSRSVPAAESGRKASIENRIARTAEVLGRKGEAVEASCRALFFDPDDKSAQKRIEKAHGSCNRKEVADPRKAP